MWRVILADIRRILRKRSFFIWLFILFFLQIFDMADAEELPVDELLSGIRDSADSRNVFFSAISVYLSVFADDMRSNAIVGITGRGLSRRKLLTAKIIDCLILLAIIQFVMAVWHLMLFEIIEVPVSDRQLRLYFIYVGYCVLRGVAVLAMSMLVQIITGEVALAVICLVSLCMFVPDLLRFLQTSLSIDLYGYTFSGLRDKAFASVSVAGTGWQILPAAAVYIFGVCYIASVVFEKKELDL